MCRERVFVRIAVSLALALAFAILAPSCKSVERMVRISPFMGDASRERVNLWPLAYHDRGATSVLWPLFDVDKNGFALRPLIAKEGTHTSFLFPLAAYDTSSSTGWITLVYKFKENTGLFPVANFGQLSWIVPFWWSKNSAGSVESGGLFPLALFGDFNYVGPVWWDAKGKNYGVFPLFGVGSVNHIGPAWWSREESGKNAYGLLPLAWYSSGGDQVGVMPFYSHQYSRDAKSRWYLLGLGHTFESPKLEESWIFPLYYSRETEKAADSALFPFYWKRTRGDDTRVFTLLGDRRIDAEGTGFNLYPFWWSKTSEERATRMLLPLFYYERDGDSRTLLSPLGGYGWTASGESRYVNLFGPLYHHSESLSGDEERTAFLWPLFEKHRTPEETTTRALPFWSRSEKADSKESWYALGLGHSTETRRGSGSRVWPLYSSFDTANEPDLLYNLTLYGAREQDGVQKRRLFPLYWSETSENLTERYYLLWLGNYKREKDKRAWRFWPLVSHSEGYGYPGLFYETTLWGHSEWKGGETTHLLGPLLYRSYRSTDELRDESETRLLTFFVKRREREKGLHVPAGTSLSEENRVALSSSGFFFDALVDRDESFHVWREGAVTRQEARTLHQFSERYGGSDVLPSTKEKARAVLSEHGHAPAREDDESLMEALASFSDQNTEQIESYTSRFPFLYSYKRHRDSTAWSGPLWLVNSKRDADSSKFTIPLLYSHEESGGVTEWSGPLWLLNSYESQQASRFNFLFYGYRSETEGARTTRDIFPFITWDSDEEETEISFLWRLFRYRSKGEESSGHFLFIPWGEP